MEADPSETRLENHESAEMDFHWRPWVVAGGSPLGQDSSSREEVHQGLAGHQGASVETDLALSPTVVDTGCVGNFHRVRREGDILDTQSGSVAVNFRAHWASSWLLYEEFPDGVPNEIH